MTTTSTETSSDFAHSKLPLVHQLTREGRLEDALHVLTRQIQAHPNFLLYQEKFIELNKRLHPSGGSVSRRDGLDLGHAADVNHILLFSDHTFLPYRSGGRESSIRDLAERFLSSGWRVTVLAVAPRAGDDRSVPLAFPFKVIEVSDPYRYLAYIYSRDFFELIIASVDGRNFKKFSHYFPEGSCLFVRDTQNLADLAGENIRKRFVFVANSAFTAQRVHEHVRCDVPVFPPLIDTNIYRVERSSEDSFVTFINPVSKKGLTIALSVAKAMPATRFLFCEGWPQSASQWETLKRRCESVGNISLMRRQNDMRRVYGMTRVLLVPSQCEEAWGRIVTEAQVSGIPCVVSDRGGLRESCGKGGIVVPHDAPPEVWVYELQRLLTDDALYRQCSDEARENVRLYEQRVSTYISDLCVHIRKNAAKILDAALKRGALDSFSETDEGEERSEFRGIAGREVRGIAQRVAASTDKRDRVAALFDVATRAESEEAARRWYKQYGQSVTVTLESAYKIAILLRNSGDAAGALKYWNYLFTYFPGRKTAYWRQCFAECLEREGYFQAALAQWEALLSGSERGNREYWHRKYLECLTKGECFDLLSEAGHNYFGEFPDSLAAARWGAIGETIKGEAEAAISRIEAICGRSESETDYEALLFLLMQAGRYGEAHSLLIDSVAREVSCRIRGPRFYPALLDIKLWRSGSLTGFAKRSDGGEIGRQENPDAQETRIKVALSWPGRLTGNRYMDGFVAALRDSGWLVFPLDMPSDAVFEGVDLIIVQFPDVIRWRNVNETREKTRELMKQELDALRRWKDLGTRVCWVVHNLEPHDLRDEEKKLWSWFFEEIGQVSDHFFSMAPGNVDVIRQKIVTLREARGGYFIHPHYVIDRADRGRSTARRLDLGFTNTDVVAGVFGSIGAYKGIEELINGFAQLVGDRYRLLIVGSVKDAVVAEMLKELVADDPRVTLLLQDRYLSDSEYDGLVQVCDKLIVPNKAYLNSGAIVYALCAGKQTLALDLLYARDLREFLPDKEQLLLIDSFDQVEAMGEFFRSGYACDGENEVFFKRSDIGREFDKVVAC